MWRCISISRMEGNRQSTRPCSTEWKNRRRCRKADAPMSGLAASDRQVTGRVSVAIGSTRELFEHSMSELPLAIDPHARWRHEVTVRIEHVPTAGQA
jgi:hypothetical protein